MSRLDTMDTAAAPVSRSTPILTGVPRADLLPLTVRAARKNRKAGQLAALMVLGSLVVVALLWVWAMAGVNAAQEQLDEAMTQQSILNNQIAKYAEVPITKAALATSQARLTQAMADDVRWSTLLNDVARTMPPGIRLTQITGQYGVAAPGASTPTAAAGGSASTAPGTMAFTGEAQSIDAVATWLDVLSKQKWYANPYLGNATRGQGTATTGVVTWQSTADLTDAVLSHRYDGSAVK